MEYLNVSIFGFVPTMRRCGTSFRADKEVA